MSTTSTPPAAPVPPVITYKNGQSEAIRWPELSFRELYALADLVVAGDTPGVIAHCTHHNLEWVESLTMETFRAAAKYCIAVNFQILESLSDSDPILGLKIGPVRIQLARLLLSAGSMISDATRLSGGQPGNTTWPTPPPAAAAPATPPESPGSPAAASPPGSAPAAASSPSSSSA